MEISVLVESIQNNGYRASTLTPVPLAAEAASREEALERLRELLRGKFANAELIRIDVAVGAEEHPWKSIAGSWQDHPDAAEFEQNVKEYRASIDSNPERP